MWRSCSKLVLKDQREIKMLAFGWFHKNHLTCDVFQLVDSDSSSSRQLVPRGRLWALHLSTCTELCNTCNTCVMVVSYVLRTASGLRHAASLRFRIVLCYHQVWLFYYFTLCCVQEQPAVIRPDSLESVIQVYTGKTSPRAFCGKWNTRIFVQWTVWGVNRVKHSRNIELGGIYGR